MLSFENDYSMLAHPQILKRIMEENMNPASGYGTDDFTKSAVEKIRSECKCPEADVYFAVGGTQANQLVISTMLASYEGVVAADTGHISTHEAGAIEYSGHKVLTVPGDKGKMHADDLKELLEMFYADGNHEHMVYPGMVYISQPTEYGSLYSKDELIKIHDICVSYKIPLYIDGARLAYGLMSNEADFTMADMAQLCEVFYIGGTKVGALCGEAIVFTKNNMPSHFVTRAKQRGALLAKGKLLGLQFDTLFTDGLYYKCGENAIKTRTKLISVLKNAGFRFHYESPTNQQFVIIKNEDYDVLNEFVVIRFWEAYDKDHIVVRLVTSWATKEEDIDALEEKLKDYK